MLELAKLFIEDDRPNLVVLGVGHSGTRVLLQQLFCLGWNAGDADEKFAESVSVRDCNIAVLGRHERFDVDRARAAIAKLPRPWAIKDPRFVLLLEHWDRVFRYMEHRPAPLWLTRDIDRVKDSFGRRGMVDFNDTPVSHGRTVEELFELAWKQFSQWPWHKLMIRYEDVARAAALFKPRTGARAPQKLGEPGDAL